MGASRRLLPIALALVLLVFTLTTAAPAAAAQRMAVARGVVIDQDGNPLKDVRVTIEYWYMGPSLQMSAVGGSGRESINSVDKARSGNSTRTKEDGSFSYPSLTADDEYRVRIEMDGFIPREEKHVFHVAGNDMGTLVLISGNVEVARKAYEEGYEAFQKHDFATAIPAMEDVVGVYGDSDSSDEMLVVALGVLGQAYLQQGNAAEAEPPLQRLLQIRLDNPIAYRGLGQVAAMKGDIATALEHFDAAVILEPESAVGRYLYGYALQMTGQNAEAIPQLQACLEAQASFVQAHKSLGMALAGTGDNTAALEHLEAYLEAAPGAPDIAEVQAKIAALRQRP